MNRQRERKMCSVEGCGRPAHAFGLCTRHYQQQRYHHTSLGRANSVQREQRLEHLLSLCAGFLHTVTALNDRICAQHGSKRSEEAQSLYELAKELCEHIQAELGPVVEISAKVDWPSKFANTGRRLPISRGNNYG